MRIGQGFDAHQLVAGCRLVIGGVEVPFKKGLAGHSDGDVLLHAVADAVLGALGAGDLGTHFPSSDDGLRGVASSRLLTQVAEMMEAQGFRVGNLDATVIAEAPRLSPHQPKMRSNLAALLNAPEERVNLKITSTDRLGAVGRGEGMAAQAVVLLTDLDLEKGKESR
jgi:2-C-methyl-D-erythritol 2,4-cyclodiphosphate synthase